MKFLGYIKGDRCGSACRDIERRSFRDPFLSDAIDGYELRAGRGAEHIRNIAELERDIRDRRLVRQRGQWPVLVFISILLIIVCAVILVFV